MVGRAKLEERIQEVLGSLDAGNARDAVRLLIPIVREVNSDVEATQDALIRLARLVDGGTRELERLQSTVGRR